MRRSPLGHISKPLTSASASTLLASRVKPVPVCGLIRPTSATNLPALANPKPRRAHSSRFGGSFRRRIVSFSDRSLTTFRVKRRLASRARISPFLSSPLLSSLFSTHYFSNRYPTFQTVFTCRGFAGSASIFRRSSATCESTVRVVTNARHGRIQKYPLGSTFVREFKNL